MNAFDKKINNEFIELAKLKQEKIAEMAKVTNAKAGEELDKEIEEINKKLQKIADDLGVDISEVADKLDHLDEDEGKGKNKMTETPYLNTRKSVNDFLENLKNSSKNEISSNWDNNLKKNGIDITDTENRLPRTIFESVVTSLTETNEVFPLFNVTHAGAMIVSKSFESTDEALLYEDETKEKVEQAALMVVTGLEPVMIYKLQGIGEKVKRLNLDSAELFDLVVAEMTQAIVNKIVDMALVEGTGKNGFLSVMKTTDAKKVKAITTAKTLREGIIEAVTFVSAQAGVRNLVITPAQRSAIILELQIAYPQVPIFNSDDEIIKYLGVDKVVLYRGTKAISPMVLRTNAVHVDMGDLTKVEAFEWKYNSNKILIETIAAGHVEKLYGAAYVTVASN